MRNKHEIKYSKELAESLLSFSRTRGAKDLTTRKKRVDYRGESFKGVNKPKRTPGHPTKSHAVLIKDGDNLKLVRFGQQGVKGSPKKKGESAAYASRRNRFKTRHAKNIARGKTSAAYWADKVKW
jgi:hypothetical protein